VKANASRSRQVTKNPAVLAGTRRDSQGRLTANKQGALHVKVSLLAATIAAVTIALAIHASPALAQAPRPSGHNIAVVDVSIVFKKHQRFLAATEKFKKDVQAAEDKLKEEFNMIKAEQEKLKAFTPGSQEYKSMEAQLAKKMADWQLKGQMQKKDLMEAEGRIYFQVYRELDDSVKRFAERNNISLVLRYASDPVDDPTDRNEIVRGINKSVVYVDPRLDITNLILDDLNRSAPPAAGVNNVNVSPVGVAPRGVQR
jgi:Skp family chaperone for outer membrane proteins